MLTREIVHSFPKAELHCHLDGSIRPKTLQRIAKEQYMSISDNLEDIESAMKAPESCQNLEDYLMCFSFVLPYLQTEQALEMAAFDVMEQAVEDGVRYIEIRFAPKLSMNQGLTVSETVMAVLKGVARAESLYAITGNVLIIGMRDEDVSQIQAMFTEALEVNHEKVVGIDLAGVEEEGFLTELTESVTCFVSGQSVQLTLHAGECGCQRNILEAIEVGATRIGHGIAMRGDKVTRDVCVSRGICIEGCPTSNIQTKAIGSIDEYPFKEWLDNGVHFCLNTDNRTVSNVTLTDEYMTCVRAFDLTISDLYTLNKYGIEHSFAKDKDKQVILSEMTTYYTQKV